MAQENRVVKDSMRGMTLPDYARHTSLVATVLGQNPGPFTGPGTNTYLVGRGRRPLLLDSGQGVPRYGELLAQAVAELCASDTIDRIVLTHAHADHIGGVAQVRERFGELEVFKLPWPQQDDAAGVKPKVLHDGDRISAEGVTLRAIFTPGHAPDHLCYYLEEERAVFTGDVVLGAGTTVIPDDSGDLGQYMASLRRLLDLDPARIYPAHGPVIDRAPEKIREYIAHRELRDRQILQVLARGPHRVEEIVRQIYTDVPESLHGAAARSVRSHLRKLSGERRVTMEEEGLWRLS